MKPRQSLGALFVTAFLAATCAGPAGAVPMSTYTSSDLLGNGPYVNASTPTPPGAWFGQYYDNMFLQGLPDVTRDDAAIDFDWGDGSPDPRISRDYFSARWTRSLWLSTGTWRFTTRTDDGVRLWVDNMLVIDNWHDQPAATRTVNVPLMAGYHNVIMEYFDLTGTASARMSYELWSDSCVSCPPPVPLSSCLPAIQAGPWQGQYYDNMFLQGLPDVTRDDAAIDFDWGQGSPDPRISRDYFSVRWTRNVWLSTGTWRFTMTTDDGVRFWVDNMLMIDEWHDQPAITYVADVSLGEGYHTFRMEYYDSLGWAVAHLDYQSLNATCPGCPGVVSTGPWLGQYYDTLLPQGSPDVTRTDAAIDFDWDQGAPDARIPKDYFSARWTQTAHFDSGIYRFHAIVDDGVRLYVDGRLVIDEWENNPSTEFTADVKLSARNHAIKVEYYDFTRDAKIKVWWEKINC